MFIMIMALIAIITIMFVILIVWPLDKAIIGIIAINCTIVGFYWFLTI